MHRPLFCGLKRAVLTPPHRCPSFLCTVQPKRHICRYPQGTFYGLPCSNAFSFPSFRAASTSAELVSEQGPSPPPSPCVSEQPSPPLTVSAERAQMVATGVLRELQVGYLNVTDETCIQFVLVTNVLTPRAEEGATRRVAALSPERQQIIVRVVCNEHAEAGSSSEGLLEDTARAASRAAQDQTDVLSSFTQLRTALVEGAVVRVTGRLRLNHCSPPASRTQYRVGSGVTSIPTDSRKNISPLINSVISGNAWPLPLEHSRAAHTTQCPLWSPDPTTRPFPYIRVDLPVHSADLDTYVSVRRHILSKGFVSTDQLPPPPEGLEPRTLHFFTEMDKEMLTWWEHGGEAQRARSTSPLTNMMTSSIRILRSQMK